MSLDDASRRAAIARAEMQDRRERITEALRRRELTDREKSALQKALSIWVSRAGDETQARERHRVASSIVRKVAGDDG